MSPIPSHLENVLFPVGDENDEHYVRGTTRCSCGCERFSIKIYANTENGYPQVCNYQDGYALVIKFLCKECGKEFLIFDMSKHGWNGFVCHDGITVPDEELKTWHCPKCSCGNHTAQIGIASQGKQDFIEESGLADGETEFNENDWVNAFDWITIGLKCVECGHDDERWIDYETM